MTEIVGLRFVAEGADEQERAIRRSINSIQQLDRQNRELAETSRALESTIKRKIATEEAAIAAMLRLERAGMSYANVLKGAKQDEQMAAQAAQQHTNALLGVERSYKSAAQSARAFQQAEADQQRVLQIAQQWTSQLNENLGVTGQRATQLGATFSRLDEVQRNLGASAAAWTATTNQNLGVTGQRATELGATFAQLAEVQRNLDAVASKWTLGLNERLGVTGQRATELGATFTRLAEVQRNIDAAAVQWTTGLNERLGVTGQRATELGATFTRLAEVQRNIDAVARQWTTDLNARLGVTGQRATELGASFAALEARQRSAAQSYNQLRAAIDPTVAAQQRLKQAHETVRNALQQDIITRQQAAQTLRQYRQRLQEAGQSTVRATDLTGRLRAQFLATANTIAILDGPLGGVASRFSAFGVLLGRTGLLLGATAVAMTALVTVAARGVRSFAEFEVQTAKINAVLETTRHAAGITGAEVERMSARIALSTLESEQAIRQAATRLLTFRDISGEVFEDVLKAATDMAALGFGTVESEATKLAKALEDPAQALTSLSRAGIVFTRQQRAMIISMVEAGDRAGAMERILANVNARVGGAAETAARDTFAGSMDTIGQAAGRAVRDLGRFIVEVTGLGAAVGALAESLASYAANEQLTLEERLEAQRKFVRDLVNEQEDAARRVQQIQDRIGQLARENLSQDLRMQITLELPSLREELAALRDFSDDEIERARERLRLLEQEMALRNLRQQYGMVERRREGIDNLQAEIDMRTRLIGLTEEQQRTQRAFAAEGLLMTQEQVNAAVERYREALEAAGTPADILHHIVRDHRLEMEGLQSLAAEYLASLENTRTVNEAMRTAEGLAERVALQAEILGLMQQGAEASEAQRIAQDAVTEAQIRAAIAAAGTNTELVAQLETALENLRVLREQEAAIDAITDAQRQLDALTDRLETILDENEVLEMQLALMDQGVEYAKAIALAEIEVEKARVQTQIITQGITDELAQQLAYLNAMAEGIEINVELRDRVAARRPARESGGGGGGRAPSDIQETINRLNLQIERERQLLGLNREQRTELEILFQLRDANDRADIQMRDERLQQIAAEIAANREALEVERERQEQLEDLARTIENQMERAFMSIVDGTKSAKDAFRDMARAILSELFRVLVVQQLVGQFRSGGGGILGALAGGFGSRNADGNAFYGGNVIPFANGGVVTRPTTFPMSGGRTGLMGEAGPEAIMPLKRGKDGKLGVTVEGSGGTTVNQTFTFNLAANGDESVKKIVAQAAPQIVEAAKSGVLDARRRGGAYRAAFG